VTAVQGERITRVLGIETSCDETAAAVVDASGRVLSDVVHSQVDLHALYGGVVPEIAARDHASAIVPVVREALARASVTLADVDAIAVTARPGLAGALLVGVQHAKGLAWASGKPLVAVDHLFGHLTAVFLERDGEATRPHPEYPFVALLASGGHTAIYRVDAPDEAAVRELGATRDDAAGEAFDKAGKLLGLGYPGGPRIDKLAAQGDAKRSTFQFVSPMANGPSLELSFSGLKSALSRHVEREGRPEGQALADVCAAFQATVTKTLVKKTVRAAQQEGVRHVVIGGGVAANRGLRALFETACAKAGLEVFVPPVASCTDNAAMIAYAGALRFDAGSRADMTLAPATKTLFPRVTRKGGGRRAAPV
jgi:N6-L-threonylcarbamoyladenine synthase